MATLPIYLYGNDVLKKKAKHLTEITNEDIQLIHDMFETIQDHGIGLAANQIGILKQILVVDISHNDSGKGTKPLVVINPEIIEEKGEKEMEEGCLSIPDVREKVWRPDKIRLRYNDVNMKEKEMDADGLMARVLQHEIDHLNGILFVDHLSATKRTLLKNKLKKISLGKVDTDYEVVLFNPLKAKKKK